MDDLADVRRANAKPNPDLIQCFAAMGMKFSNLNHIVVREFLAQLLSLWDRSKSVKSIRLLDRVFNSPSSGNTVSQNKITHSNPSRQVSHARGFAPVCKSVVASSIVSLLCIGRPSTVRLFVVSVVVNAVKGVLERGLVSHVHHKALEAAHSRFSDLPPSTHLDSSSAVVWILRKSNVSAPCEHHRPLTICRVLARCRLVVCRKLDNVFSGLAHFVDGLSSSEGHSQQRVAFAPYSTESLPGC